MYVFGDSFDLYSSITDATSGYWDSGAGTGWSLVAGRFTGGQGLNSGSGGVTPFLVKSSGSNDAVHHIVCAFWQSAALSGTTAGMYFQLSDGSTNQCSIVFRSDGAILLTSATPTGTTLATYTGAVAATNTWYAFEFEVIINSTTGRFRARKNGNSSDDFDSGATLNTRPGTNNYANKLSVGMNTAVTNQRLDDILWRSDPSSVPFVGDVRAYVRMPASDASVQFSRSPATAAITPFTTPTSALTISNGTARYTPFTPPFDGTISNATVSLSAGYTGNMKCAMFSNSAGAPGAVLGSATTITNPVTGTNTFTFSSPIAVSKGTQYWIGWNSDTTSGGNYNVYNSATAGWNSTTPYASFPLALPGGSQQGPPLTTLTLNVTSNYSLVNETLQDGTTGYVYDTNPGDSDLYTIGALSLTPASIVAVTTRGFLCKSDAGSRTGAMQLKSGSTTVNSGAATLSTVFGWMYRTDLTDPATGAAWTAAAVSNLQIGPVVVT